MTPERWQTISTLFEAAIDLPPGERDAFLLQSCPNDEDARQQVANLLAAEPGAGEALVQRFPTLLSGPTLPEAQFEGSTGMAIGAYQLECEVGRGGMGSVWRAHRVDGGFEQTVAIKLIKRGMDTDDVIRRFEQERQILSLLDHPNIARLLDGGATADGRPYLVMEFIDGKLLLDYCREQNLSTPARLELFRTICAAVQHAHSHLVIHRDLKPGNILIRGGEVKLLDFGIARILDMDEIGGTVTAMRMLTPAYASPEQRDGLLLTTAADIYSLGRILDALFGEDPKPSDIVAIVAKATRDEPAKRYHTVEQLSEDVRRFLTGRPVDARAGAWSYRTSKFVRRHAWSVAGAAALTIATFGGLAYVGLQNRRIQLERDRAENISHFLRDLFSAADPERNQGNRLTTRELLDLGAVRLRSIADPQVRSALLETTAEAYFNLGLYEKASAMYGELIVLGSPAARLARAWAMLAESEAYRGRPKDAENAGQKALALLQGLGPADRAAVLLHRCNQLQQVTQFAPAIQACQDAESSAKAAASLTPIERSAISISLGTALMEGTKFNEAETAFRNALALARSSAAEPMNSTAAQALSSLGSLYFRQGRFPDAEKTFRETIEFKRKLYPDGHLELARSLNNLANTLVTIKRQDEAVPIYLEAHALYRKFLGPESSDLASSLSNLAVAYSQGGRLEEAEKICAEVVDMQARTIGPGKLPHISSQMKHAAVMLERGKSQAGVRTLEEALDALNKLTPRPAVQAGYTRVLLAQGLLDSGQMARAEVLAKEARSTLKPILKPGHWMLQQNDIVLGGALVRTGKRAEGRELLEPVVAANEAKSGKGWWVELARRYYRESSGAPK